jgi:hypothetical protein
MFEQIRQEKERDELGRVVNDYHQANERKNDEQNREYQTNSEIQLE